MRLVTNLGWSVGAKAIADITLARGAGIYLH